MVGHVGKEISDFPNVLENCFRVAFLLVGMVSATGTYAAGRKVAPLADSLGDHAVCVKHENSVRLQTAKVICT